MRWMMYVTAIGLLSVGQAIADEPANTNGWRSGLATGVSVTRGNSRTLRANIRVFADRVTERSETHLSADGHYGETSETQEDGSSKDVSDIQNGGLKADQGWTLGRRGYAGFSAELRSDKIADVDYRLILSPSLGRYLVRDDQGVARIDAGPAYVVEKVGGNSDDYVALRLANRIEWKLSETASLVQTAEYIPRLDDLDNYLLNASLSVRAAITGRLSLMVECADKYNNRPAADKEANDFSLSAGVEYTL